MFPLHDKEELKRLSFSWYQRVRLSLQPLGEWRLFCRVKPFSGCFCHALSTLLLQMLSGITSGRGRRCTLVFWSTSPSRCSPWPSWACRTTCLTGRTTTNMSCLLFSTWCGAQFCWRYGAATFLTHAAPHGTVLIVPAAGSWVAAGSV